MTTILIILLIILFWKPVYHWIQVQMIEDADSDTYHNGQMRQYWRDLRALVGFNKDELHYDSSK